MPNIRPPIKQFTPSERRALLKQARLIHRQDELDIRSLKRDTDSSQRVGRIIVITPKKVGTAPQRNKLRRRFLALYYEEECYKKAHDLVIYCRKGSAELSFQDLKTILTKACESLPA